ncbi:hypothetical protein WAJ35_27260, partial [Acinetobacter baumannii]
VTTDEAAESADEQVVASGRAVTKRRRWLIALLVAVLAVVFAVIAWRARERTAIVERADKAQETTADTVALALEQRAA